MSAYCVPLYDSLGENAIEYIVRHAEAGLVFVSAEKLPNLLQALPKLTDLVKTVVVWGGAPAEPIAVRSPRVLVLLVTGRAPRSNTCGAAGATHARTSDAQRNRGLALWNHH
jgi:hypothetical protein